jgi:hypothetical protein
MHRCRAQQAEGSLFVGSRSTEGGGWGSRLAGVAQKGFQMHLEQEFRFVRLECTNVELVKRHCCWLEGRRLCALPLYYSHKSAVAVFCSPTLRNKAHVKHTIPSQLLSASIILVFLCAEAGCSPTPLIIMPQVATKTWYQVIHILLPLVRRRCCCEGRCTFCVSAISNTVAICQHYSTVHLTLLA